MIWYLLCLWLVLLLITTGALGVTGYLAARRQQKYDEATDRWLASLSGDDDLW